MSAMSEPVLTATSSKRRGEPTIAASASKQRSAIVVGAGVVGVATAYALARRQIAVTLIDAANEAGAGTSRANGAQLSYVFTDALASPALLRRAPGLLLGLDPVFRWRVPFEAQYFRWLLKFVRNAAPASFRANTLEGLRLGLESRAALHALLARHPLEFAHREAGKIHVHDDPSTFAAAGEIVTLKRAHGARQELLSYRETLDVEPALAGRARRFVGAVHSPQEEVGDPFRFCQAMLALLRSQYAVEVRLGTPILQIRDSGRHAAAVTAGGEALSADTLVLCGGIESGRFMRAMGCAETLVPMKGYSFNAPRGDSAPRHSITDVARKWVMCQLGETIRVAGLAELGKSDLSVDPRRLAGLIASAREAMPAAADFGRASDGWAGLRSMTPTSLPVVRCLSPRLALNVGHGMLGWTFAMGTAERLATQIAGA
jgi:D-amino-acid dehydrogenase